MDKVIIRFYNPVYNPVHKYGFFKYYTYNPGYKYGLRKYYTYDSSHKYGFPMMKPDGCVNPVRMNMNVAKICCFP